MGDAGLGCPDVLLLRRLRLSACQHAPERLSQHQRHGHRTDSGNGDIARLPETESSDAAQQEVPDQHVQKAPQHIDPGRRESFALEQALRALADTLTANRGKLEGGCATASNWHRTAKTKTALAFVASAIC